MKKVSIVIPVYGQWHLVKRNIDALMKYDREHISEIIAVDDCSPESNPYLFNDDIIKVIKNEKNLGYTGTVNNGLRCAKSEILILLDSDAYPIGPFVQELIHMCNQDPSVGCIGFGTVDDDGNKTGSFEYEPTVRGLVLGQFLAAKLSFISTGKKNILPYSCAVLFKKECIEEMNYFDGETFPVLDADFDLSMRIHRSKWKLVYNEKIKVCHSGGHSYKINYKRVLLYYKSRWKLFKKHEMIKFPNLSKSLIKFRLRIELGLLKILCILKVGNGKYEEKKEGRKIILKEVDLYEV